MRQTNNKLIIGVCGQTVFTTRPDPTRPAGTRNSPIPRVGSVPAGTGIPAEAQTPIFTAVVLSKRLSSIDGLENLLACLAG